MSSPFLLKLMMAGSLVPFGEIKYENILPVAREAAVEIRANLKAITDNPEPATFENTILALENSSPTWDRIMGVYGVYRGTLQDPKFAGDDKEIRKLNSEIHAEQLANQALFARVRAVWEQREALKERLSPEDLKLLENYYDSFASEGAALDEGKQKELEGIRAEIADLRAKYMDNLNAENESRGIWVTDEKELEGIPADDVARARESARTRSGEAEIQQWFFSVQYSDYAPVMKFAKSAKIRKRLFIESNKVGATEGPHDNRPVLKKIATLRYQMAQLLGYPDYAAYVLRDRMAKNIGNVEAMHSMIIEKASAAAKKEFIEVQAIKERLSGQPGEVEAYDSMYYTERLTEEQFQFNQETLKPYFKLESVLEAVYKLAGDLYGISFEEIPDAQVYHPDVKVLRVKNREGVEIAQIYCDYFVRAGKRQGAWQGTIRSPGGTGADFAKESAAISLVTNFAASQPGKPTLITADNVRTIFHEFGHALHTMLSTVKYKSLGGTNVPWDFVEVPSQMNERFPFREEFLQSFARHFETGEALGGELLQRFLASRNFRAASRLMGQVKMAMIDLAWHSGDPSKIEDIEAFENDLLKPLRISKLPPWPGSILSTDFAHIFSGGYAAGYYSYLWSEILAADFFEVFRNSGQLVNAAVGQSVCEKVLSQGGSREADAMARDFLGRDPLPDAFLKEKGLLN